MSAQDVLGRLNDANLVLVDCRGPAEQAVSRIPGALTQQQFDDRLPTLPPSADVVAYCTIGARSGSWVKKLNRPNTYNMVGSLLAWTHVHGCAFRRSCVCTSWL